MSSDEEVDDFEVSDYDMAASLGMLKRRKQTKESQIYGVWVKFLNFVFDQSFCQ